MSKESVPKATDKLLSVSLQANKENGSSDKPGAIALSAALDKAKYGKFNYFIIFISGMVLANVLLEIPSLGFIMPIMQCDLSLTNEDKGVLSAVGYAGIIVSSHLWGFLADTKGRRHVIWPTLVAGFVVTLFSSFVATFWQMATLRFINGFFVSGGSATIYAYLGEFHTDKTRSRAIMGSSFVFALGAMMLPFIAFAIINRDWILPIPFLGIDYKPWRLFMLVCSMPGLLCGFALYALPESPKFLLSMGREEETIEVVRRIARWNGVRETLDIPGILAEDPMSAAVETAEDKSNFVVAFIRTMWNQTVPLFRREYLKVTLIACFIQFWLYVVTNGLYMWFPYIINSMGEFMKNQPGEHKTICEIVYDKHGDLYKEDGTMECITKLENTTYMYSLLMEISYAVSFFILGVVINRVSKITILFVILVAFSACGIVAVIITDPVVAAYLYVLYFLTGLAINVLGAATIDLYPTQLRGMAICISLMAGRIGGVMGSTISGALLSTRCEATFHVCSVAMILCAFIALLIPRAKASEDSPQKPNAIEMS